MIKGFGVKPGHPSAVFNFSIRRIFSELRRVRFFSLNIGTLKHLWTFWTIRVVGISLDTWLTNTNSDFLIQQRRHGYVHRWEFEFVNGKYKKSQVRRHEYVPKGKNKFVFGKKNNIQSRKNGSVQKGKYEFVSIMLFVTV